MEREKKQVTPFENIFYVFLYFLALTLAWGLWYFGSPEFRDAIKAIFEELLSQLRVL